MKPKQLHLILLYLSCFLNVFGQKDFDIQIDNQVYSNPKEIVLKAGYHSIVFNFPKIEGDKVVYQYYLENIEHKWITSEYPFTRYTNLEGGNYIFYGKIVKNNRLFAQFSCKIEVLENFWEKWWFWIFVSLVAVSGISLVIYFWFLYDFRQRMKTQQIRQRIAADLHDEVGANLNSITFITEMLRKQGINNDKTDLLLEKISANSMESATLISDTIWALNPNYDSLEKLIERIKSFALGLLSAKDIAFAIEDKLTNKSIELPIEQRRNLYLIIKEAINNIAKHSAAKKAFLRIEETNEGIRFMIEDDGVGFDSDAIFDGNGLKNYKFRANEENIEVKIESKIGLGTQIMVNISNR